MTASKGESNCKKRHTAFKRCATFNSGASNTMEYAGNLPDSEVFSRPESFGFGRDGLVRKAGRMAYSMLLTSRPPVARSKAASGLQSQYGAETMTTPTTPKTGTASTTTKTLSAQALLADAATSKADDLSLKLYGLTEIVKLAAFASEARRTLQGISGVMKHHPEMQAAVATSVGTSSNWEALEDVTGNVLAHLARELDAVNVEFTQAAYALANAASSTEKMGV
jgi:hypothetical protein